MAALAFDVRGLFYKRFLEKHRGIFGENVSKHAEAYDSQRQG